LRLARRHVQRPSSSSGSFFRPMARIPRTAGLVVGLRNGAVAPSPPPPPPPPSPRLGVLNSRILPPRGSAKWLAGDEKQSKAKQSRATCGVDVEQLFPASSETRFRATPAGVNWCAGTLSRATRISERISFVIDASVYSWRDL